MKNLEMPIKQIGERDWKRKLTDFLESYDIEALPLNEKESLLETEERLSWKFPKDMKDYYLNFGGSDNTDFMSGLYPIEDIIPLAESSWEFVLSKFSQEKIGKYIVFAESPATDPLCMNRDTFEIVLFSHDPVNCGKVYNDFSDYLKNEIINVQEFLGELEFEDGEKMSFMADLLSGENIDYEYRHKKLE